MAEKSPYVITRVRLVNFHNFTDELIEIADGGHLFLVGDNGSGKTTLLDAIHYVLSAGRSLEFNAAARIAGGREGGRRLQGIIMRYNLDKGPLNPQGGITYAAIEIKGRQGKPLTVGIGMSALAMDEKVQRWGVIRECALDEIPFGEMTPEGFRPWTRDNCRDELDNAFYQIGAYEKAIAERLFGGEELFAEACRFLSIGKSYREIVTKAADYHELFKQLLPEPRTELFERIIETLGSLDKAQADLQSLEDKLTYAQGLGVLLGRVASYREEVARYRWLTHHLTLENIGAERTRLDAEKTQQETKKADTQISIDQTGDDLRAQESILADLQTKDAGGVVRQEKERSADLERQDGKKAEHEKRGAEIDKTCGLLGNKQQQERDTLAELLASAVAELKVLRTPLLPIPLGELLSSVDNACAADPIETAVDTLSLEDMKTRERDATMQRNTEAGSISKELAQEKQREVELLREIDRLESQGEAAPQVSGFLEALAQLKTAGIAARPLYTGLEVQPGTSSATLAALEETIGEEVLATLQVSETSYPSATAILFGNFPRLRLTHPGLAPTELPEWIRQSLDLTASEPDALLCLAGEMESRRGPEVHTVDGHQVLGFRAHERRLEARPARLIGRECRKLALLAEIAARKEELKKQRAAIKELEAVHRRLASELSSLKSLRELLDRLGSDLSRIGRSIRETQTQLAHQTDNLRAEERQRDEVQREIDRLQARLTELRAIIAREGLAQLEQRMRDSKQSIEGLQKKRDGYLDARSRINKRLEEIVVEQTGLVTRQQQTQTALELAVEAIRTSHLEIEDVAYYVLRTWKGFQFKDLGAVESAIQKSQLGEREVIGELRSQIRHPAYGASFAFTYEEPANRLTDRRDQTIDQIIAIEGKAIEDQRDVINEKTSELFKKIIMNELVTFLRVQVSRLDQMVKKINSLLGERFFGTQQYQFRSPVIDKYKRLVEIIRHFSPFDTEAEAELRNFFEDHRTDILDTENERIPESLDFRNWFRYEMHIIKPGEDGVLMDRQIKSLGSGGEQAVPNYLLILTIAHFLYQGTAIKLHGLLFDEAFYGIDPGRRDELLGFATDLGLQLFVASPDQDGVNQQIRYSTSLLVVKDEDYVVHLYPYHWKNPANENQFELLPEFKQEPAPVRFGAEQVRA